MIGGALVVDGHVDTPLRILEGVDVREKSDAVHLDLPRMAEGGVDAAFFAAWIDPAFAPDRALARCEALLGAVRGLADAAPDRVVFATSAADVRAAAAAGRIALLAGVENGQALEGRVANAARIHALGARYLTITWMNSNEWGDAGGGDPVHGGLSAAGRDLVRELNALGMLVDVAHASRAAFFDALELSTDPVVASHAGTEARGPHPRNLDDDQLRALGACGGLIGIAFMPAYLDPGDAAACDWTAIVDHMERAAEVAGIDAVALGSDFDGVPRLPKGMRGVEDVPRIAGELERRGWSAADRAKALGGNWLRVIERVVDRTG